MKPIVHAARWLLLVVGLAGCPFGRPKEVDCQPLRAQVAQADVKLAPLSASDPSKATVTELQAWADALQEARALLEDKSNTTANAGVRDVRESYRKAMSDLRAVLEVRARGGTGPGAEVEAPRRKLAEARTALDRECPAPPTP